MKVAVLMPPLDSAVPVEGEGLHTVVRGLLRQLLVHGHRPRLILPEYTLRPDDPGSWQYPFSPVGVRTRRQDSLILAGRDARGRAMRDAAADLTAALDGCDLCIAVDTVFDVHCLALTTAVRQATRATGTRLVFYSFECTWPAPHPHGFDWSQLDRSPWDVIGLTACESEHAFPAEATRDKIAAVTGIKPRTCWPLPPVLGVGTQGHWDGDVVDIWSQLRLWDREVLFLPALRRTNDNIDTAVQLVAGLKARDRRPCLLLTYLTDHDDESREESGRLRDAIDRLKVRDEVVFLSELRPTWAAGLPREAVQTIYHLCDLVVHPSTWEGFGLVAVEAVLARTPLLSTDLPVLREVVGDAACFVPCNAPIGEFVRGAEALLDSPQNRARRSVQLLVDNRAHFARFTAPLLRGTLP